MRMQLWELKERVDALVELNGDGTWLNMDVGFRSGASAMIQVIINEDEL